MTGCNRGGFERHRFDLRHGFGVSQRDMRRERLAARGSPEIRDPRDIARSRVAADERVPIAACPLERLQCVHHVTMELEERRRALDGHPDGASSPAGTGHYEGQRAEAGDRRRDAVERRIEVFDGNELLRERHVRQDVASEPETLRVLLRKRRARLDGSRRDVGRKQDGDVERDESQRCNPDPSPSGSGRPCS